MKRLLVVFAFLAGMAGAQNVPCTGPECKATSPSYSPSYAPSYSPYTQDVVSDNDARDGKVPDRALDGNLPEIKSVDEGTGNPEVPVPGMRQPQKRPALRALPPRPKAPETDFQKFVAEATRQHLPIYGQNLFEDVPSTFAPLDRVPVPSDYVIGPGDELMVRIWGQLNINAQLTVDRTGQVYLPKLGAVTVAGIKYDQLTRAVQEQLSRIYRNFEVAVTLGRLRSIQVFVVGNARRPGTYTVSSFTTLVNALFASGGPAPNGSMRHIQVKRGDKAVTEFDLYELLAKGNKSKDIVLQQGDVIYIPPVGPMVAFVGNVNTPGIYELCDGATLGDQLAIAGGLTATASGNRVVMERIDNHASRVIEETSLEPANLARKLQDGDLIRVFPVSPKIENAVTLRGNVAQPGRYAWRHGMRVRDLIPNREFLVTRRYWSTQNALVSGPSWGDTKEADEVADVNGFRYNTNDINWDYAVIQRMYPDDLSTRLLTFSLGNAIKDPDSEDNLLLQSGDVVMVFSQKDVAVPENKRTKFVRIEGEVKAAGVYRVNPGETLRDLVQRAGGLTDSAYLGAAQLQRQSVREEQAQKLGKYIETMQREAQRMALQSAASNDPTAAKDDIQAQKDVVERLKQVQPNGRVVLRMDLRGGGVTAIPQLALEDGDRFYIPSRPSTVDVMGAVFNPNAFVFREGGRVGDYVAQAGGATREGDKGRMFVIRADGSVVGRESASAWWHGEGMNSMRLMPGDTIVVPDRLRAGTFLKGLRDWSQVFSQFALGAAAVKVIAP